MNLQTDIQYLDDCVYTTITAKVYNFINISFHLTNEKQQTEETGT